MRIPIALCMLIAVGAHADDAPAIVKHGTIACDLVEATPIVFNGTLYRFEYVREQYKANPLGKACFRFVNVATGEATPPFAAGQHLGSAYTENGRMYVYSVGTWGADAVQAFWSDDLKTWQTQDALKLPGWGIYNNSVCKSPDGYTMAIEIGEPEDMAGARFTMYFAHSTDRVNWTLAPTNCVYSKEKYTACPALRYYGEWYYMVYLEHDSPDWRFVPHVIRSRDLKVWETSPKNPLMEPGPEDKVIANPALTQEDRVHIAEAEDINNSDLDFCEHDGNTLIYYSWGNQRGIEFLAEAHYPATERAFLESYFD